MERVDKVRASDNIGLGWSDQSKDNHSGEKCMDQR